MVIGNQTAKPISAAAETNEWDDSVITSGIRAVAGSGPTIRRIGMPQ